MGLTNFGGGLVGSTIVDKGTKCMPVFKESSSKIENIKFLSVSGMLKLIDDYSKAFFFKLIFI